MINHIFTTSGGEEIPVIIEVRRGLRNITIRPKTIPEREIHISKPWLVPTSQALQFLKQKGPWLEKIFAAAPRKVRIKDGDIIEFLGRRVQIRHDANQRSNYLIPFPNGKGGGAADGVGVIPRSGGVAAEGGRGGFTGFRITTPPPLAGQIGFASEGELIIGGAPEMLERRARDFIKNEFLAEIKKIVKTAPPEFWPQKIALRDTTSRWGSCSASGTVHFSWRLAFAPTEVMRYIIMHELAHKKHMDHSKAFWRQVSALYGPGVERAKRWLGQHGEELHRYF